MIIFGVILSMVYMFVLILAGVYILSNYLDWCVEDVGGNAGTALWVAGATVFIISGAASILVGVAYIMLRAAGFH